jgi:hypothetical protein
MKRLAPEEDVFYRESACCSLPSTERHTSDARPYAVPPVQLVRSPYLEAGAATAGAAGTTGTTGAA